MKHLGLPLVDAYLIVRSRRLSVLIQPNMRLLYNLCGWEIKLAKERANGDERKIKKELSRTLTWPYLAKEVHALNDKYLHWRRNLQLSPSLDSKRTHIGAAPPMFLGIHWYTAQCHFSSFFLFLSFDDSCMPFVCYNYRIIFVRLFFSPFLMFRRVDLTFHVLSSM